MVYLDADRNARINKWHRERVKNMKCQVDTSSPRGQLHKQQTLRMEQQLGNEARRTEISKENKRLCNRLNVKSRASADISTFATTQHHYPNRSRLKMKIAALQEIENQNSILGCKLKNMTSTMKTKQLLGIEGWRKRSIFHMPWELLAKYNDSVKMPEDKTLWRKLLRPIVYFNIAVRNGRPLGRLIIELFTEACPQIVLELVRACHKSRTSRLEITHLFPNLWLGIQLQLGIGRLKANQIEYDMRAVDHSRKPGVLSFARSQLKNGFHGGLDFSISFRPLRVLNGQRVGFGRVIDGLRVLKCIALCGTRSGLTLENLFVSSCGTL